jgi:hypothetical protein
VATQDFTPESFMDQFRNPPNVINMGMGEKQKLNVRGYHRPSGYGDRFIRPLRNAAIDQYIQSTGLKKMTGTCDAFFSPKMENLKNIDSLSCCNVFLLKKLNLQFLFILHYIRQHEVVCYKPSEAFTG